MEFDAIFRPRRPFDNDWPDGHMESDVDFVNNNFELCVQVLEEIQRQSENQAR